MSRTFSTTQTVDGAPIGASATLVKLSFCQITVVPFPVWRHKMSVLVSALTGLLWPLQLVAQGTR